ncbi:MAG: TlpA disulfide reductase family protein [Bacteroidia bacterium]
MLSNTCYSVKLKTGIYRGALLIDTINKKEIPFLFEIKKEKKKYVLIIRNATERIRVDEIRQTKDSLFFKMPVFDTEFRLKKNGKSLEGVWINHYRKNYSIPFKAWYKNENRFIVKEEKPNPVFQGKWECHFSKNASDYYKAIGVFKHIELSQFVTGTFLTETGDYRYLEGVKEGSKLLLSCFDGSHAFLFEADLIGDTLKGWFYSGKHWKEPWYGFKNENASLNDPEEISKFENNNQKIDFSFKNLFGKSISLSDEKFKNKPVIIQIMGSWCPNCMDESKYLSELYQNYQSKGLEIIALAFEKTDDFAVAQKQVNRLVNRFDIRYEVLITELVGKDKALAVFPGMNKIISFPTTIFLDKNHRVVKIHTGFSGPATGKEYEYFKSRTTELVEQLIK